MSSKAKIEKVSEKLNAKCFSSTVVQYIASVIFGKQTVTNSICWFSLSSFLKCQPVVMNGKSESGKKNCEGI